MASTLCISCKNSYQQKKKNCPYCGAPQAGASVIKLMMNSSQYILNFFIGANVFLYLLSLIYDIPSALSLEHGILGIGALKVKSCFVGHDRWTCLDLWTLLDPYQCLFFTWKHFTHPLQYAMAQTTRANDRCIFGSHSD